MWVKIFNSFLFGLGSLIFALGCSQQQKLPQVAATSPSAQNEVIIASTPIVAPVSPAPVMGQSTEFNLEKKALLYSPMDINAKNKAIQLALRNANLYSGEIDGKIGPLTKQAIRQFQRSKNLAPDGIIGSKTWMELRVYLPEEQKSK